MFGSKKPEPPASTTTVAAKTVVNESSNALNSLVKGTVVEGIITSENDIRVDGVIKGNLVCKAKVIIGPTGVIEGEVKCQNAMIEGKMSGKLRVDEQLTVKETAEVIGDVTTGKLQVQAGAIFNVTCNMRDGSNNSSNHKHQKELETIANGTAKK